MRTRRQKVVAILAGALVAGGCLFAFSHAVRQFIDRQGQEELQASAQRKLALAEDRINRLIEIGNDLHRRGIDSCGPQALSMLRQTALSVAVIKEIALIGADGQTQCTTLGSPGNPPKILSSQGFVEDREILLELLAMGPGTDNMLRVRWQPTADAPGLAIMLLGSRVFSHRSDKSTSLDSIAIARMRDGALIGQVGDGGGADTRDWLSASLASTRFGVVVTSMLSPEKLHANASRLQMLGLGIFGGLALTLVALYFFVPSRHRDNPIAELERALHAGEFVPYYQPIVDLVSGKLRGAEVLIRWRKADGSVVPPAAFIPLAESSGIILDMTRALMRRVCKEIGPVFAARPHLKVSFNLAARHFEDETIVRDIREIFGRNSLRMSQVVLELTERQPIENLVETRRLIATLQGLGVRMAIDDVGTGHSGLSYILKLGVDIIKIDKMFVDAVGIERSSTAIIETLIDLAHNMRMEIIAEGVETFEQVVCLRDLGIRAAQGFVFAPALPGSSFMQLIEAIDPAETESAPVATGQAAFNRAVA